MKFLSESYGNRVNALQIYAIKRYGITLAALKSPSRSQNLAHVRFMLWRALQSELDLSSALIGRLFNRDHTTVMYGIKMAKSKHGPLSTEYDHFMSQFRESGYAVDKLGNTVDNLGQNTESGKSYQIQSPTFPHVTPSESRFLDGVLSSPVVIKSPNDGSNPHIPSDISSSSLKYRKKNPHIHTPNNSNISYIKKKRE